MKKFLRNDWRFVWRFWSLRIATILMVWNMMPMVIQELIPPYIHISISAVLFISMIAAQYTSQPKLEKEMQNGTTK
jgi:hypothetical protein